MPDKREDLMVRLKAIAETVTGIETVQRNKGLLRDDKRPAIVILDGDESVSLLTPARSNSAGMSKTLNTAKPEIYVLLKEYRPNNESDSAVNVGTMLGALRKEVVKKIATDSALLALLGPNGKMQYTGCVTDLKSGSALSGEMRLDFSFSYVFDPNE